MRASTFAALTALCLSLAGCASAPPETPGLPPGVTMADVAIHTTPRSMRARCDEAKIHQIVAENLPMALRYPPNSAHREAYLEIMRVELDHMRLGLYGVEIEKCEILQNGELLAVRLKLEEGKRP